MNKSLRVLIALSAPILASACAIMEPKLPQTESGVGGRWPAASPAAAKGTAAVAVADIGWRDYFTDPRLAQLIGRALENNRDLRVAVLAVERARALYRVQRADEVPALGAAATGTRSGGGNHPVSSVYAANLGVSAFEIDLFGRVRSLSKAALEQFLAQEEARRGAQLSLVAEVANAWLTLAADAELLRVSRATLTAQEASFDLTRKRHELGAASALDLNQARTTVETARADVARYEGLVARDGSALTLLAGAPVEPALLPEKFAVPFAQMDALPAGLPSEVLLRRPDILRAEHALRSANANIGAARAAFFPSIRLTGAVGTASDELSGLFGGGSFSWSMLPSVSVPIFSGGRLTANLEAVTVERDIALAQYEKSIQAGFREVSDALALSATLARQREAQELLVEAAAKAHELSKARWEAGRDSYLGLLDAQRSLYAAQQGLVAIRLAEQTNRVTLYKVLGGGWKERNS